MLAPLLVMALGVGAKAVAPITCQSIVSKIAARAATVDNYTFTGTSSDEIGTYYTWSDSHYQNGERLQLSVAPSGSMIDAHLVARISSGLCSEKGKELVWSLAVVKDITGVSQ